MSLNDDVRQQLLVNFSLVFTFSSISTFLARQMQGYRGVPYQCLNQKGRILRRIAMRQENFCRGKFFFLVHAVHGYVQSSLELFLPRHRQAGTRVILARTGTCAHWPKYVSAFAG